MIDKAELTATKKRIINRFEKSVIYRPNNEAEYRRARAELIRQIQKV